MNWDIFDERLFRNREKVKKLVRLKKKGVNLAKKLDVPFERLVDYKNSIRTDLKHAEEEYEIYTNFYEFNFRVGLEAENIIKYKDLPKSKFIDINGKSSVTKLITEMANDDSVDHYFKKNKLSKNQELFVVNYIACRNQREAATRAGYAPESAGIKGCQLMAMPKIQKAIALNLARPLDKFNITPESVIQDLVTLKERAMKGHPIKDAHGNFLGEWKCQTREALKAVEMLGNYLGMFQKHTMQHVGHDGGAIKHEIKKYNYDALSDEELRYFQDRILPKIKVIEVKD